MGIYMSKKFFEVAEVNGRTIINEVVYPHCPMRDEEENVILVYAEDRKAAFNLAMRHRYDGLPIGKFYGEYAGETYHGIRCVS